MAQEDHTCPECGKELPEGEVTCPCGYSLLDACGTHEESEEPSEPLEGADAEGLDLAEDIESLPDGPREEMETPAEEAEAPAPPETPAPAKGRRTALIGGLVALHVVVIALIIVVVTRPGRPGRTDRVVERVPKGPSRARSIEIQAQPGSLEADLIAALDKARLRLGPSVASVGVTSKAVSVLFRVEAAWDLDQLRRNLASDAAVVVRTSLARFDSIEKVGVRAEARMGGESGTEWEEALRLVCTRRRAEAALKESTTPEDLLKALGAQWHSRLRGEK